jgi:hypothetical protein
MAIVISILPAFRCLLRRIDFPSIGARLVDGLGVQEDTQTRWAPSAWRRRPGRADVVGLIRE